MRFRCSKEDLLAGLNPAASVVESRQTLPILGHLHLQTGDGEVSLTGTDLEVELQAACVADVEEAGTATVPARKFLDIVRSLPEETQVAVLQDDGGVTVQAGRGRYRLSGLNPEDFPRLELEEYQQEVAIPQGALKALFEGTSFAMARDDVRYYLNGILLEWSGSNLRAVATDGHRLALMDREVEATAEETRVILPRKGVQELERLLADTEEPVSVGFTGNHVRFRLPRVTFTSKLIEGRFPDYRRVIPEANGQQVLGDRRQIQQALRRIAILSNRKTHGIRFSCREGLLELSAENPDQEEGAEEVPLSYQGDSLEIGFNVEYLQQAMSALPTDEVVIHVWDAQSSCLIMPPDDTSIKYVIMPMRL
ncbi:DNA polymerase III subunit beta [Thiohalorhabdus methylotrophus]|uniref:Beta sliding clamp n=1 Tax=Thiohalorhabdus methylotrophus TaxID=3242694 RepID=A0ABV4TRZ8_9GAMM